MAKRKQSSVSPRSARRIQKHKLSDIRWRTNLAKSFKALERTVAKCNGEKSLQSRSRITVLDQSLSCIQALEAKVEELCNKNAESNGFKRKETFPKCFTLDYFRKSFTILDNAYCSGVILPKDQNCHVNVTKRNEILSSLLELDESNFKKYPKPLLKETNCSSAAYFATKRNYTNLNPRYDPAILFPFSNFPLQSFSFATLVPEKYHCGTETALAFDSISVNPSASSTFTSQSIPFTPKKGSNMDAPKNKQKTKFAPPRLSTKVRRRLDMDKADSTIQISNASADVCSTSTIANDNASLSTLEGNNCVQGDINRLSEDLKDINLSDVERDFKFKDDVDISNFTSLYDFDGNEDFPQINVIEVNDTKEAANKQEILVDDELLVQFLSGTFHGCPPQTAINNIEESIANFVTVETSIKNENDLTFQQQTSKQ